MRQHVYTPPTINVIAPGDGNRVLHCSWPSGEEEIMLVLLEETAKEIGKLLQAPSIALATELPPGVTL
jgi:hypothetical protein